MLPTADMIESTGDTIEKIGKSDRTLFAGMMIIVFLFVCFFLWQSSSSMRDSQTAFLSAMEKRDDKMINSLDRVTSALNKNTEVMIEIKTRIK